MDIKAINRIILRLFPEFTGKWHLPHAAKVVALTELPHEGDLSDRFYPHYAADVKLLDSKFMEREDIPTLQAVPLPVPGIGDHAGRLEPPAMGAIVEVAFFNGEPDKPFIRTVLPLGWKLPAIKAGESRYQQRPGVYQHVDDQGNFRHITDKLAQLHCDLHEVRAKTEQDHRAPKTWLGSEGENVLKLLSELMQVVTDLSDTCASHTHPHSWTDPGGSGTTSAPDQSADMAGHGEASTTLKGRLDPITK
ncbi:hypothetical protein [Grimontia marina]|uniref:Uncharacterized protein n=1 Tax=Grimontia marina TaxID=646534 RepID=A0A128F8Y1_9GAMM|nr:hypothetical protein [Grimontia marina]CZF83232.1 hypothetical protein GMA8713_02536 [Grimontia marina]